MNGEAMDMATDLLSGMTDAEKLSVLARIGAQPRPLAHGVVKVALRLKPGRERRGEPPVRQQPRAPRPRLIKRRPERATP